MFEAKLYAVQAARLGGDSFEVVWVSSSPDEAARQAVSIGAHPEFIPGSVFVEPIGITALKDLLFRERLGELMPLLDRILPKGC